jgi:hypothetical protein
VAAPTTAGFRDLIEIGRAKRNRPALFVRTFVRPKPVVERKYRFEVDRNPGASRSRAVKNEEILRPRYFFSCPVLPPSPSGSRKQSDLALLSRRARWHIRCSL